MAILYTLLHFPELFITYITTSRDIICLVENLLSFILKDIGSAHFSIILKSN